MFDFSILITVLIAILIFYFTLYITLKKEIGDLSSSQAKSSENQSKIDNRKSKLKFLNIITIALVIIVVLLYLFPYIVTMLKKFDLTDFHPITFSDIGNFLTKLVPFKKGFFSDFNFTFSYITEIVAGIISYVLFLWLLISQEDLECNALLIILSLISFYMLIWVNNYVSLFLTHCIIHSFIFLSIVFNLCLYIVIFIILCLIYFLIDEFL